MTIFWINFLFNSGEGVQAREYCKDFITEGLFKYPVICDLKTGLYNGNNTTSQPQPEQWQLVVVGLKQSYPPGSIKQESKAWPACNNTGKFWPCQLYNHCMKANFTFWKAIWSSKQNWKGNWAASLPFCHWPDYKVGGTPVSCIYCLCMRWTEQNTRRPPNLESSKQIWLAESAYT